MVVRVHSEPIGKWVLRLGADLLILAGVSGVLVWLWALGDGALYQHVQRLEFAREVAGDDFGALREEAVPEARPQTNLSRWLMPKLLERDPRLIGRLEVPRVGLTVMVREGIDSGTLRKAVGHLPSSTLPGEAGNFVVLGHRDTFFRPLRDIAQGDEIRVQTAQGRFTYAVESIRVVPPDYLTLDSGTEAMSTLITCFPFDYTGPAPRRFVVEARLVPTERMDLPLQSESAK